MINGAADAAGQGAARGARGLYAERGLDETYRVLDGVFSVDYGARGGRAPARWPTRRPRSSPAATSSCSGSLKVLHARGVRLGRDISFVGLRRHPDQRALRPAVAVVRRDTEAIGRSAAELVLALLRDDGPVADVTLPSEFVARGAAGPPSSRSAKGRTDSR